MSNADAPSITDLLRTVRAAVGDRLNVGRTDTDATIAKVRHLAAVAVYLNALAVSEFGGRLGPVRERALVEQVIGAAFQTFGGTGPHPAPFDKAAMLLRGITQGHPCGDGNERTGFLVATYLLDLMGYPFPTRFDFNSAEALPSPPAPSAMSPSSPPSWSASGPRRSTPRRRAEVSRPDDLHALPPDLPIPVDDGACDHLPGLRLPSVSLPSTAGGSVDLADLPGRTVVYCYPRTGRPDEEPPPGWNAIPGARGCTPQSCAFRDHHAELGALGARVFGLSTQATTYQAEAVARLHLPFALLSDADLHFARALRLPTFEPAGMTLIKRLTMIVANGRIEHVFYPVFPPDADAGRVVDWLERHRPAEPAAGPTLRPDPSRSRG